MICVLFVIGQYVYLQINVKRTNETGQKSAPCFIVKKI